jgi:hypothetical protein
MSIKQKKTLRWSVFARRIGISSTIKNFCSNGKPWRIHAAAGRLSPDLLNSS